MVDIISRLCAGPLKKIGAIMKIDEVAVISMLSCTANVMPLLHSCNKMSPAGVVVSLAFCVGANSMLGDFLGFVAGVDSTMIVPMMISNITAAIFALPIAMIVCRKKHLSTACKGVEPKKYRVKRNWE